jgi:hypothetical protein
MTKTNDETPHANQKKPKAPATVEYVKKSRDPVTNTHVPQKK